MLGEAIIVPPGLSAEEGAQFIRDALTALGVDPDTVIQARAFFGADSGHGSEMNPDGTVTWTYEDPNLQGGGDA